MTTTTTTRKCTNFLFEDDGYCPKCGVHHFVEAFGKVHFYQPAASNKEETSAYSDMDGYPEPKTASTGAYYMDNDKFHTLVTTRNIRPDGDIADVIVAPDGEVNYVATDLKPLAEAKAALIAALIAAEKAL